MKKKFVGLVRTEISSAKVCSHVHNYGGSFDCAGGRNPHNPPRHSQQRVGRRGESDNLTEEAVAVLTAESCSNCDTAVEDAVEILGGDLDVVEIDVTDNEDALRFLKKWGHRRIPVTYRGEIKNGESKPSSDHFCGRDRLQLKRWRDLEKAKEEK